jgi:anti-sigma regulatory factor (Ser/Thr protein kinase)
MATLVHLRADARPESIRLLRNAVASLAGDMGVSSGQIYAVKVCVNEAITNAVKHAYAESEPGPVEVDVHEIGDELAVVVVDHGRAHDRTPWKDQGGFGLAWVERLTASCTFTATAEGTTVELRFPLPRGRTSPDRQPVGRDDVSVGNVAALEIG